MIDHYRVLGVGRDAPSAEIRSAYLRLARQFHPDRQGQQAAGERASAEVRMREVNAAWAVLSDPARRRAYDEALAGGPATGGGGSSPRARVVRDAPGPGWAPRAGDDAWMHDFRSWAEEGDDLVPPERPGPPRSARSRLVTVLPPLLLLVGVAVGAVGLVMVSRGLVAVAFTFVALACTLFVALPLVEMRRSGRRR